jgi:CYTH domain-containing protein
MNKEIERKWLLDEPPSFEEGASKTYSIKQAYGTCPDQAAEVRVRSVCENMQSPKCWLTTKIGDPPDRIEVEKQIAPKEFSRIWNLDGVAKLSKMRHVLWGFSFGEIVVDQYENGLLVAEIEFEGEAEMESFTPRDWFGKDVTSDPAYSNCYIAHNGIPEP